MARWEFKLPDIGEGVTEGEIVSWLIKPGDMVKEDQPMIEVMTDKATVTITSPKAGRVVETVGAPGTVVAVHSVLVVFELDANVTAASDKAATHANGNGHTNGGAAKSEPAATAVGDIKENLPGMGGASAAPRTVSSQSGGGELASSYFNAKPLATPATRKLARDMEIDLRAVPPTGPQGRVTKVDVETFAKAPPQSSSAPAPAPVRSATIPMPAHERARDVVKITAPFTFVPALTAVRLVLLQTNLASDKSTMQLNVIVESIRKVPTSTSRSPDARASTAAALMPAALSTIAA